MYKIFKLLLPLIILALTSCSNGWLGKTKEPLNLEGERISIFDFDNKIDPSTKPKMVKIAKPVSINSWPKSSEGQLNNVENIHLNSPLKNIKKFSISSYESSAKYERVSTPIYHNGKIFFIAGKKSIYCVDEKDLSKTIWKFSYSGKDRDMIPGGGLSFENDTIYATIGHRDIVAINAQNGKLIWQKSLNNVTKSVPVVHEGVIYCLTSDNKFYALSAKDGTILWSDARGSERTSMIGNSSFTIYGNQVLIPSSSGEIFAINKSNGSIMWSLDLAQKKFDLSSFIINDIDAAPIVEKMPSGVMKNLYIIGQMGALFSFENTPDGLKLNWQQNIKGPKSFWHSGNSIFVIDEYNRLIACNKKDGSISWVKEFTLYENDARNKKIDLSSILIVNNQIIVAQDNGKLFFIDPENGHNIREINIPKNVSTSPIVTKNGMLMINNNGELIFLN